MCDSRHDILLLAEALDGLSEPFSPDVLAMTHPSWAADAEYFAPWRVVVKSAIGRVWQAATGALGGGAVWVCGACNSCLDVGWALKRMRLLPDFGAVLAVQQWSGRGQLRRSWYSPPGNLYVAWSWPRESESILREYPNLIPLAASLAVTAGLDTLGVIVGLKWPNDLVWHGRKIGGLLVEERGGRVLVGLGINLVATPPSELLREEHALPAGALAGTGVLSCRGPLGWWVSLAIGACRFYKNVLHNMAASSIVRLAEERLVWIGRKVLLRRRGRDFDRSAGIIMGVADDGALRLLVAGQERRFTSGSIILLSDCNDE